MRRFWLKLFGFLLPLLVLYSVPLLALVPSGEILSPDTIAQKHAAGNADALYGPAYTNPDKRYKLVSTLIHDAPVVAIGTSRVMQLRAAFFEGDETTFYNAGGLISRVTHLRRALAHVPRTSRTAYLIVGLDQWSYNDNWDGSAEDPGVEAEYGAGTDALGILTNGLQAWPDFLHGKLVIRELLRRSDSYGVNAIVRRNGFRRDGSYLYSDILAHPESASDFGFKDTLRRVRERRDRFEAGSAVSERGLGATRRFLAACRERGLTVVGFLPPFAPTVAARLRDSKDHAYLGALPARLASVFADAGVPFFDFTSCEELGCTDAEFLDGYHGGETVYARLLIEIARVTPWIASRLASGLRDSLARSAGTSAL